MSSSSQSESQSGKKAKNWIPLESNPELLNKYLNTLGVSTSNYQFTDVYGTDPELLSMVPQPIIALILLFPHSEAQRRHAEIEEETMTAQGRTDNALFHIKQSIGNACGTIGVLHSVLNNREYLTLSPEGFASKYYEEAKDASFEDKGRLLEESDDIEDSHQELAREAKSDANHSINDNLHFIAFVEKNGHLWEFDGMKKRPIDHGRTAAETLLGDSIEIVKKFMKRDEGDVRFSMAALGPTME